MKNCAINNYIPRKTPRKSIFNDWYIYYEYDLINLYEITKEVIVNYFPENNLNFQNFCKFIYNRSSKYIPKY